SRGAVLLRRVSGAQTRAKRPRSISQPQEATQAAVALQHLSSRTPLETPFATTGLLPAPRSQTSSSAPTSARPATGGLSANRVAACRRDLPRWLASDWLRAETGKQNVFLLPSVPKSDPSCPLPETRCDYCYC